MVSVPRGAENKPLKGATCKECGSHFYGKKGQRYCHDCLAKYPDAMTTASQVRRSAYKLSFAQEAALMAITECEVCGSSDKLVIDHNHDTGKVRGRICWHCNVALGHARDNVNVLRGLALYIEERDGS